MHTTTLYLTKASSLLLLYAALLANTSQADVLKVTIPPIEQSAQTSVYYSKLLQLALHKTEDDTDGPFKIIEYPHLLTKARFEAELKREGVIDVIWSTIK
jgi:hypothetical protein